MPKLAPCRAVYRCRRALLVLLLACAPAGCRSASDDAGDSVMRDARTHEPLRDPVTGGYIHMEKHGPTMQSGSSIRPGGGKSTRPSSTSPANAGGASTWSGSGTTTRPNDAK
jgi:hypothetical protein